MHTHKSELSIQIDAVENALFPVTVNPLLKFLISRFDREYPKDGNLLLSSLQDFWARLFPFAQHANT